MTSVAALVFVTTFLMPALQIGALLYLLLPLKLGRVPHGLPRVFRLVHAVRPWGMVEVFMLGMLVRSAKLAAHGLGRAGDRAVVVRCADVRSSPPRPPRSMRTLSGRAWRRCDDCADGSRLAGLLACHTCGLVHRAGRGAHGLALRALRRAPALPQAGQHRAHLGLADRRVCL